MRYYNLPFKFRIFFGCVLVAIVPLILSSVLTVRVFQISANRQILSEGQVQIETLSQRLEQFFSNCQIACENLAYDGSASWVMIDNTTVDIQKDLYLSMYQAVQELSSSASFNIYDVGGKMRFSTNSAIEDRTLPIYWGVLRKAAQNDGIVYYATNLDPFPRDDILMQVACSLNRPKGARTGYMVLDFSRDNFNQLFGGFYSERDTLILLDEYQNLVYSSRPDYSAATISGMIEEAMKPNSGHGTSQYLWTRDASSGYYLLLQKNPPVGNPEIQTLQTISIFLAFLGMVLSVLISILLSRSIAQPISRLDSAMTKVREGDLSIRIHTSQNDELGRLTQSFNQMTEDLQKYLNDTVQKQKDLNETQLKLYQTQLNPHFLYNTLDSIKWTAKIHQLPEAATMAENLAVILRRSISSKPFVTLSEELETLKSYIKIQKIRFSGQFLYELEIADQLESCLLPKMILQPIVENAILHGLEGSEDGYICIYASQAGENLHISVMDNGVGMSQNMLEWLNSENPAKQEGHLGLYNVIQILKLYYGHEYGLKAALSEEGGTIVTVILPIQKGEIPYV